jgi:hypothetical protein
MRQQLEEARRAEQEEKENIKQQKKADKEAKAKALKTKQKTDKEDMALAKKKKKGKQARLIFHPLFSPLSFPISQFPSSLLGSGI